MGQWFNSSALQAVSRIRDARLLVPHISVPHIGCLDFRELRARGIRGVILDKDNTLTAPYADDAFPGGVAGGLDECRAAYGTDAVILSNSAGTGDDPGHAQALAIEASLGLPVLRHALKKPACMDAVREPPPPPPSPPSPAPPPPPPPGTMLPPLHRDRVSLGGEGEGEGEG